MVKDGELTHYRFGRALRLSPEPDAAMTRRLENYYDSRYGLQASLLNVPEAALPRETFETVACRP